MKKPLVLLFTLAISLIVWQTLQGRRHPAYSWPELPQLHQLNSSPTSGGTWEYRTATIPLLADGEPLRVTFGCGGGSNDYCQVQVTQTSESTEPLLRFAGNCDVLPWQLPRIFLEPVVPGRARRFLTYHKHLVNDSLGENLPGGYWLWVWNGTRFQPQRLRS